MQKLSFGILLKRYRKIAGFQNLRSLANALADEGLIYSESLLSRWQKDLRLPKDRGVFLVLLRVFIIHGAIKNVYQANAWLSLAGMGYLSLEEVSSLLERNNIELEMNFSEQKQAGDDDLLVKISLTLPKHLDRYLEWISHQYKTSKAESLRQIIDKQIVT